MGAILSALFYAKIQVEGSVKQCIHTNLILTSKPNISEPK